MPALTEAEKVQIRHHLGYLNVQEAATFVLGTPAGVETQFIIEGAFNRVLEAALPLIRKHIQRLDTTEEQMVCSQESMEVNQLGEIQLNNQGEHRNQRELRRAYNYWADSLANLLGVYRNPFDKRTGNYGLKGMNVRVQH